MTRERYTPDDVLELEAPTEDFLCPLSANTYGIEFLHFSIADYESKSVIFEIGRDTKGRAVPKSTSSAQLSHGKGEAAFRTIRYEFSEDVLRLPSIMTELEFAVGPKEVTKFRMIERHYFRDEIVKSFDFTFGFCIPSSVNTWEAIYSVPPLDDALIASMIAHPYATVSDTFYFVGDELIMHNKAEYKYIAEDRAQAKRSYDPQEDDDDKTSTGSSKRIAGSAAGIAGGGAGGSAVAAGSKCSEDKDAKPHRAVSRTADAGAKWSKETDYN